MNHENVNSTSPPKHYSKKSDCYNGKDGKQKNVCVCVFIYNVCLIFLPKFKAKFFHLPDFFTFLILRLPLSTPNFEKAFWKEKQSWLIVWLPKCKTIMALLSGAIKATLTQWRTIFSYLPHLFTVLPMTSDPIRSAYCPEGEDSWCGYQRDKASLRHQKDVWIFVAVLRN